MKLIKMYYKSKEKGIAISMLSIFLFIFSFFIENTFLKILLYTIFVISAIYDFYFICKILILKKGIKSNKTIIKTIQIKYISDISSIGGYRQNFAKSYYGIKIVSNRKNYLYFYKNISNEKSDFNIHKRFSNLKKVKVEVYKSTNVIKKVLANI